MSKLLWEEGESDWTFAKLEQIDKAIHEIAVGRYGLSVYPNQIEMITSEQMMDAYVSHAMPIMYNHWSFGKHFTKLYDSYKRGQQNLAYEVVINSSPCISYLMEENSIAMQTLVIAHACYGHNSFFKNNYLFKQWTSADSIIDYLLFAKNFIQMCEEKYGHDEVEDFLDSCHALQHYGVDKYKKPRGLSKDKERERQKEREEYMQSRIDDLWMTLPPKTEKEKVEKKKKFLEEPQENLLYFIEKNSPILKPWQREVVRIVRKLAQYFYPQMQTKLMNEGWATFWHYTLINDLWDCGMIHDGAVLECLKSHTNVVAQPPWDHKYFSGLNPYYVGFNIFRDIRRMCESPTEEDAKWFPEVVGKNWVEQLTYAMENFKDESFVMQYLSPKVIRDLKLFVLDDNEHESDYEVANIHDDAGYKAIREKLSSQYHLENILPDIQIVDFDFDGDRTLYLKHTMKNGIPLGESTEEMLKHVHRMWGFDVLLESFDGTESKETYGCLIKKK
jgi:stage V sporulation protein R